ncbi:bifunctional UDP-sugar hydrolase/5'-nucleotidase periplasmic precursor [Raoultella terrigena]|uniref:Bifunctional UDP-sugar hydrolase/5'-nucleotidase periplasmic n=1 Tax=Raoultella terrigena TaxID=577 RepID=A0A4U9DAH3_RAOTE|nr:bifunctional UDP-sugar hydrolase/5'-nucleotidase periplasmic precursor [Raoultella terrigena]
MQFVKQGVALALLAALSLGSLSAQAYEQDKTYKITILHTNDHHGHFWRSDYGEYGLSAQKTLVDGIRKEVAAEGGSVLLLSGGDINTGVPESDLQDAEPDFRGMNLVGYDAMAWATTSSIIRSACCASRRSGLNSRSCRPIFTRKAPVSACLSPGPCLSAAG